MKVYNDAFLEIIHDEYHYSMVLDSLWANIEDNIYEISGINNPNDFELTKEFFFYAIELLMKQGHLKLAKNGCFLTGTIEQQIELFKQKFPKSKADTLDKDPNMFHTWWFSEACPAGAVWVHTLENGEEYLEWT